MTRFAVYNGELILEKEIAISPINRGMMYGDGCFATVKSYQGKFMALESHFDRLKAGAEYLGMQVPFGFPDFKGKMLELLEANEELDTECIIRIQCWREGERGYATDSEWGNWLTVSIPTKKSVDAVSLSTVSIKAIPAEALTRQFKWSNGIPYILAANEAKDTGADDALLCTTEELISETTIANIFWVKGFDVYTPSVDCDLYPGITRELCIKLLENEPEMSVIQGRFRLENMLDSDCVFLTNSLKELTAVSRIDDQVFPTDHASFKRIKEIFAVYRDQNLS